MNRESLCFLQGKDPNEIISQEDQAEEEILPEPNYDNLQVIAEEIAGPSDLMKKRRIVMYLLQEGVDIRKKK